ncbi:acetyl-CoA carboxylase biotin carboxyl carrier protein [Gammaproteobacteria bacterium]|jgi:acetyl-CoA carboxylase biotin carboxyl carrier protein|nr:acetyl-CoA carboxylase biotin carboxyl carrier protein [Gammaproteobacteria bacterium]
MDIRKIKKLIEMLQDSDLNEIEVKEGEESVRIARGGGNLNQAIVQPSSAATTIAPSDAVEAVTPQAGSAIKSPIVGTFYRKPAPDRPPFVEVGSHVNAGDVVCIVEAMKMMNEIKSEFSGKVLAINIEDGEPVEFDQSLIVID